MDHIIILENCVGFEWDSANAEKNWFRHHVSQTECEQTFFNHPIILHRDEKHSQQEERYYLLGQTDDGRELFIVFTIRKNLIRIISARDMSRKEREIYAEA